MSTDFDTLNRKFGCGGQVAFKAGPGGLAVAEVSNAHGTAVIALQGAHVMTWAPWNEAPVIWLSKAAKFTPGKSIRGGAPVCWPWFGPHAENPKLPGHGFARTVMWDVTGAEALADGATRLSFRIRQDDATRAQWPHASEVMNIVTVGRTLELELVTRNTGAGAITIGDAYHTYFEVSDIRNCRIDGLDGCPYLDKADGGRKKQQAGPVTIDSEVDRIYLESTADIVIDDPGLKRRIRVAKRGSRSSVVWNPWVDKAAKMGDFGADGYLNMVCVESSNAADDVVSIPPGGEHRLWVRYGVEPRG
ncbi:MAG: D-hexose-6-phosphate mutarotase [Candidatus Muproteobacteria bacterium RBG_16_62_13]|uniref:Putative glucose-6-phosphate 1-epimerase n=1 Tax=Candidatus Muproteobacteria bacterium RBG_16_62_13 TaxID=1817756 RepID=A0A1F6T576_9PROT|nr:MAG: D-hexose-6-phosphate mutarotase [Candidatus Muproteobacteria bacterium RBG_16_62_13]